MLGATVIFVHETIRIMKLPSDFGYTYICKSRRLLIFTSQLIQSLQTFAIFTMITVIHTNMHTHIHVHIHTHTHTHT